MFLPYAADLIVLAVSLAMFQGKRSSIRLIGYSAMRAKTSRK